MKKHILSLAAVCITTVASAQISFNVKAGLGFSTFYGANDILVSGYGGSSNSMGYTLKPAWKIGVGIECPFNDAWSIAPSLFFSSAGADTEEYSLYVNAYNHLKIKGSVTLNYIQIPVNVQWRAALSDHMNIVLYAGPYFAFGVGGKTESECNGIIGNVPYNVSLTYDSFKDAEINGAKAKGYETFDLGLNYGVNLEFNHFIVGLNMDLGLAKTHKIDEGKNIGAGVMLGYKF